MEGVAKFKVRSNPIDFLVLVYTLTIQINFFPIGIIMATETDTTVQFRINSTIKEGAFSVFHEMGISPSEAMRVFITQVYKTRTLPLVVSAESENGISSTPEAGYVEWLRARLQSTIAKLDSGEMKSYSTETAKAVLHSRLEDRRKKYNLPV